MTRLASSSPAIEGNARASATSCSAGVPSVDTTPRSAPDTANVAHQRARIQIPDHGNVVAAQVGLRGFGGTPVRRQLRKFAHHQRLDVRPRRFLVVRVGAHVSDVRIRQADDLPGVTRVGEDFLISGEAGIENDFAAAARLRARGAAVKYPPIFEREGGEAYRCRPSVDPPNMLIAKFARRLFCRGVHRQRDRTEMVPRPIGKHRFAVNKPAGTGPKIRESFELMR